MSSRDRTWTLLVGGAVVLVLGAAVAYLESRRRADKQSMLDADTKDETSSREENTRMPQGQPDSTDNNAGAATIDLLVEGLGAALSPSPLSGLKVVSDGEQTVESSFMPVAYRASGDTVMRRWTPHDLIFGDEGAIGGGVSASVIAAQTSHGAPVAIKTISNESESRGLQERHIRHELSLLKQCAGHPNVVQLQGYLWTTERVYMVFPLAITDMAAIIETRGHLNEATAIHVTKQLLSALEHLHERRIVHNDVKPANILVNHGNNVVLADLGSSEVIPENEDTITTIGGTKPYMSPEQIRQSAYTTKVDIWATGAVVFEMLHGRTPFDPLEDAEALGRESTQTLEQAEATRIVQAVYTVDHRRVGATGEAFLSKLLRKDPEVRLSAKQASEHTWLGGAEAAIMTRAAAHAIVVAKEKAAADDDGARRTRIRRARKPASTTGQRHKSGLDA